MKSNNEAAECKLEQLAVKVGYNSSVDTDEQLETIMEEEEEEEREREKRFTDPYNLASHRECIA